jgi:hypothetical protein
MTWLSAAKYGRLHGVSRQRVMAWINSGMLACWHPSDRIYMVDAKTPRPKKKKGGRIPNAIKNKQLSL